MGVPPQGKILMRPLGAPLVEELPTKHSMVTGFTSIGMKPITTIPHRPLGKSIYHKTPWSDDRDDYIPTEMSRLAMEVGLTKAKDPSFFFPESLVKKAECYVEDWMKSIWVESPEDFVLTFEEAVQLIHRDKSAGYPYYYRYQDKGAVLDDPIETALVKQRVFDILEGKPEPCFFSLTEKSELRPKEKVYDHKTRVFMASDIHHLLASKILYTKQNDKLMDTIGQHPITIGVSLPGPQFTNLLLQLTSLCNDADVSGCDLRFNLRIARSIYRIRHAFLPMRFAQAGHHLYSSVYAGLGAALGALYRLWGNKSGWENTGHDNSFMTWICLVLACFALYPNELPHKVLKFFDNGDDLIACQFIGEFKRLCDWLRAYGMIIEAEDWLPRPVEYCVYLSHHLENRYVSGFGDFICAAGNLPKILCSLNWVKKSKTLSFPESCVAHLLGLRLCLFPWKVHFDEVDQILSRYLLSVVLTDFIIACLPARLDEMRLAFLHTRVEGVSFFSVDLWPSGLVEYWKLSGTQAPVARLIIND